MNDLNLLHGTILIVIGILIKVSLKKINLKRDTKKFSYINNIGEFTSHFFLVLGLMIVFQKIF